MADTLKFTQSAFLEGRTFSTGTTANVSYDILSATTVDRRVYGVSVASTDAGAQTIKLKSAPKATTVWLVWHLLRSVPSVSSALKAQMFRSPVLLAIMARPLAFSSIHALDHAQPATTVIEFGITLQ